MDKKLQPAVTLAALSCTFLLLLNGCSAKGPGIQGQSRTGTVPQGQVIINTSPQPGSGFGIVNRTRSSTTPIGNTEINNVTDSRIASDARRSDAIRTQLNTMREIRQANVIVNCNTALVAYRHVDPSKSSSDIKNLITTRVKQADASITNVVVSDLSSITTRMNQLLYDISNNRPANDIDNTFRQIIQDVK